MTDAATPSSEEELTPDFLQAMFFAGFVRRGPEKRGGREGRDGGRRASRRRAHGRVGTFEELLRARPQRPMGKLGINGTVSMGPRV